MSNIQSRIVKAIKKVYTTAKGIFLSGLFTILPLTLTIGLFIFSFKIVKSWLAPITCFVPRSLACLPHAEIILIIILIFLLGAVLKFLLLHSIVNSIEGILRRIPLLRQVYFGIKQLVHALSAQDKLSFQKVVMIEFPRPGFYSLGFMTSELNPELSPNKTEKFYSVFIPTTPNPTTGYYVIIPEKQCIIANLTRQEAMAIIISGGIIQPERIRPNN